MSKHLRPNGGVWPDCTIKGASPRYAGSGPTLLTTAGLWRARGSFKVCLIPTVRGLSGATLHYAENSPVSCYHVMNSLYRCQPRLDGITQASRALLSYFLHAAQANANESPRSPPAMQFRKKGNRMVSKISEIVSDEYFADWVKAFIPIAGIIILAIAFVTISLVRGGIGQ